MLDEAKHTPGPWSFDSGDPGDDSVGLGPTDPSIFYETFDGDVVQICSLLQPAIRVDTDPTDIFDEGIRFVGDPIANARVIIAAPDYYAAVEQMLANENCGGDGWREGFGQLKAAHAKAKGSGPNAG